MAETLGKLYLIPNVLYADSGPPEAVLPASAIARVRLLRHFIVEGERSAWRLLAKLLTKEEMGSVVLDRLDEHSKIEDIPALLSPLLAGTDLGLLSEAGLPCIADPGGALVAAAHDAHIVVVPLVGPSSILLALGASGLEGQKFSFLGYLPQERAARRSALAAIDRGIRADGGTRIFIETPYRNDNLLADCLEVLSPDTRFCVAAALTTESERIRSTRISTWRTSPLVIGKEPAVFLAGRDASMAPSPGMANQRDGPRCKSKNR